MDSPWRLNGPAFLLAYALVLAMLCVCVFVVRAQAKEKHRARNPTPEDPGRYARAYLNGASDRVADTALAGLIELGAVRVSRERELFSTGSAAADDVQRELLTRLGSSSTVSAVRSGFRGSEYCDSLLNLLREDRLIASARSRRRLLVLLWGYPLLMLVDVVWTGSRLGLPIDDLNQIIELVITLFVWLLAIGLCGHPLLTKAGDAVVRRKPRKYAKIGTARPPEGHAADQVAAYGLSAYPDRAIAKLLKPPKSANDGDGGDGDGGE